MCNHQARETASLGAVQDEEFGHERVRRRTHYCVNSRRKLPNDRRKGQRPEVRQRHEGWWREIMKPTSVGISNPDKKTEEQGVRESSE